MRGMITSKCLRCGQKFTYYKVNRVRYFCGNRCRWKYYDDRERKKLKNYKPKISCHDCQYQEINQISNSWRCKLKGIYAIWFSLDIYSTSCINFLRKEITNERII